MGVMREEKERKEKARDGIILDGARRKYCRVWGVERGEAGRAERESLRGILNSGLTW